MVFSNCHAERFKQIDWPKKEQKKERINVTILNGLRNSVELCNSEFILLWWNEFRMITGGNFSKINIH